MSEWIKVDASPHDVTTLSSAFISIKGLGNSCQPHGPVLTLEEDENGFRLFVFADINSHEPTHVIKLYGAKEENYAENN
jgi:hypothetical protein